MVEVVGHAVWWALASGTLSQVGAPGGAAASLDHPAFNTAVLIPFLPLLGVVLVGFCAIVGVKNKLPAWISVGCLAVAFILTLSMYFSTVGGAGAKPGEHPLTVVAHAFNWIDFQWGRAPTQHLIADFSFYIDTLTCLWMLFVTGLGTLIALYASEYMAGDVGPGYCRFFAAFNLFVFSMACLVMADNLLLLYLGWEGVGLCSYLLIGYFYKRPSAVAAAKKAFVMNRIGDLGLSMGVMLTFIQFGTVRYADLFPLVTGYVSGATPVPFLVQLIPVLFTVGAFGKSAQFPLYVWLPDAMEGPTPVSALIHAATMVTAGVYLVARFMPLYAISEWALPIVAWTGALTALLAATIGMAQFDIKRIMAYSTVSQLGYMFAGLGVMGSLGAASHVFTHAFFKALLFLACGAVMHGFAGQLDLRKISGLRKMPGWRVVAFTMLIGCLNLAGFPIITSGFWSKDIIIADAFSNPVYAGVGWVLLITAGLTAYYTFRVYFRVFEGPVEYHPGDEHHGGAADEAHGHDAPHQAEAEHTAGQGAGHFHPHAPGLAISLVLVVLALASFAAIRLVYSDKGWMNGMVQASTAAIESHEHSGTFLGWKPHEGVMYVASAIVGIIGIAAAWWLHLAGRTSAAVSRADRLVPALGPVPRWAQNKWYVDELYNFLFYVPLRVLSHILHIFDKLLVDGLVNAFGAAPRGAGYAIRPTQNGLLHAYALRMVGGIGLLLLVVLALTGGTR